MTMLTDIDTMKAAKLTPDDYSHPWRCWIPFRSCRLSQKSPTHTLTLTMDPQNESAKTATDEEPSLPPNIERDLASLSQQEEMSLDCPNSAVSTTSSRSRSSSYSDSSITLPSSSIIGSHLTSPFKTTVPCLEHRGWSQDLQSPRQVQDYLLEKASCRLWMPGTFSSTSSSSSSSISSITTDNINETATPPFPSPLSSTPRHSSSGHIPKTNTLHHEHYNGPSSALDVPHPKVLSTKRRVQSRPPNLDLSNATPGRANCRPSTKPLKTFLSKVTTTVKLNRHE